MDSIGIVIQQRRLAKGLTLDDVHAKTRIPLRFLKALEEDDRSAFPAEVYYLGAIRTCGRYLGLDASSLVLQARTPAPAKPLDEPAPLPQPDKSAGSRTISAGLVIAAGSAVVIFIAARAYYSRLALPPVFVASPAPEHMAAPAPVISASEVKVSSIPAPAAVPVKPAAAPVVAPAVSSSPVSAGLVLEITAVGNSWIKVVSDGKTVYEATMAEGTRREWNAQDSFRVVIGYVPGVKIACNGEQVNMSALSSEITELNFTRDGIKIGSIQPARAPTGRSSVPAVSSDTHVSPAKAAEKKLQ